MVKLALIGLDGMSWRVLLGYADYFKTTLRLAAKGIRGTCWCVPPFTPPSWVSISTGVVAKKHRIFGFSVPLFGKASHYKLLSSHDVNYPRLSELLAMKGMKSVVINHPLSYPPSGWVLKNQVLIADDVSPRKFVSPQELEWCLEHFRTDQLCKPSRKRDSWVPNLTKGILHKIEGIRKLMETVDPNFLWIVFREPDLIMHFLQFVALGRHNDRVADLFSTIDNFIKEISQRFDYVLIVSDHGFGVYVKRVNLFGVLSEHRVVSASNGISKAISKLFSTRISGFVTSGLLRSLLGLRVLYDPRDISDRFLRAARARARSSSSPNSMIARACNGVTSDEFGPDSAFMLYFREEKLRQRALETFLNYIGDLFERVEALDFEECSALLVVPRRGLHFMNAPQLRGSTILRVAAARHSPAGIFILGGSGLKPNLRDIENVDVAPTVLSLFGLPVAKHFDGQSAVNGLLGTEDYISKWRLLRSLSRMNSLRPRVGRSSQK